jgi:hypothetical protein
MLGFVILLVLTVVIWILGKATKLLTKKQTNFLLTSIFLYVILVIVLYNMLTSNGSMNVNDFGGLLFDDKRYFPLFLFIIWFYLSCLVGNLLTKSGEYTSFSNSRSVWVSEQDKKAD